MSNIVPISPEFTMSLPSVNNDWDKLSHKKRELARARESLIKPILNEVKRGVSARVAIEYLLVSIKTNKAADELIKLAQELGRKNNPPSSATIARWIKDYKEGGLIGLVSKKEGRVRVPQEWDARAIYWYGLPSKLAMAAIADLLKQEDFTNVGGHLVSRYIKSLPKDLKQKLDRKRMGAKLYGDTQKPARIRDTEVLPIGSIYQGDGHTIDAYLAHPMTGNPWRPELTVWIDVRSRYLVGWYMSVAESSYSTLFSLSHAMITHDHVPAGLHIDNGSGFRAKMMHDKSTGFYSRFDLSVMFSIPGNPQGKGQVERWFRTLRDKFDKTFASYCGHDMAPDAIKKVLADAKSGKEPLPSLQTYLNGLTKFIEFYNNRVHSALNGATPASLWAQLERVPVHMTSDAIIRPRIKRTVRRGSINLFSREYRHPELVRHNKQEVFVEYNLHDDSQVRVMDLDARLIVDATLTHKTPYLSDSRIEDMTKQRLKGQIKRLERHADEKRAQAKMLIDHEEISTELDSMPLPDDLNGELEQQGNEMKFDINDTDYGAQSTHVEMDFDDTGYTE